MTLLRPFLDYRAGVRATRCTAPVIAIPGIHGTASCSVPDASFPSKKIRQNKLSGAFNFMKLTKIESKEDYLEVTLAGQVSFSEATVFLTRVRDVATESGFDRSSLTVCQ
jgi:hypothetical protein